MLDLDNVTHLCMCIEELRSTDVVDTIHSAAYRYTAAPATLLRMGANGKLSKHSAMPARSHASLLMAPLFAVQMRRPGSDNHVQKKMVPLMGSHIKFQIETRERYCTSTQLLIYMTVWLHSFWCIHITVPTGCTATINRALRA